MIQLSLPIEVTPPSCTVPRFKVQHSRMVLLSPMTSWVGSPLYFLSCGISPIELNWKKRLPLPMLVWPSMTACGPTTVPAPISTCSPMME